MSDNYSDAVNRFIIRMSNIHDADSMESREAMDELCGILNIAHIEYVFYETMLDRNMNRGSVSVIFNKGNYDNSRSQSISDMTDVGNPVILFCLPIRIPRIGTMKHSPGSRRL
ncbi:MAG: hypothetical protein IKQ97_08195 [Eubacterium sp.]|nr:hypothetical protein [Eubacterium sp.]